MKCRSQKGRGEIGKGFQRCMGDKWLDSQYRESRVTHKNRKKEQKIEVSQGYLIKFKKNKRTKNEKKEKEKTGLGTICRYLKYFYQLVQNIFKRNFLVKIILIDSLDLI